MDLGELSQCALCGNPSRIIADRSLHYACGLCGAPRIPHDTPALRDKEHLAESRAELAKGKISGGFATLAWVSAAVAMVLGALTVGAAHVFGAALLAIALGLVVGGSVLRSRGKAAQTTGQSHLDAAWQAAALRFAQAQGNVTAEEVAAHFGVSTALADRWMMHLSTTPSVNISNSDVTDVTRNASVRFEAATTDASTRARVSAVEPAPRSAVDADELAAFDQRLAAAPVPEESPVTQESARKSR